MRVLLVTPEGDGSVYEPKTDEQLENFKRNHIPFGRKVIENFDALPEFLDKYGDVFSVSESGEVSVNFDRLKLYAKHFIKRPCNEKQAELLAPFPPEVLSAQSLLPLEARDPDLQKATKEIEKLTAEVAEILKKVEDATDYEQVNEICEPFFPYNG